MFQYEGELYGIRDYQPSWATSDPPQIYIAASAPRMLQLATRHADGLMMSDVPLERLEDRMKIVRDGLSANGRSPEGFSVNNFWAWHVKKDKDASIREARRELVWRGVLETWYLEPYLNQADCELVRANFGAFRTAHYSRTHVIEGVPDRVIDPLVENLSFVGDLGDLDGIIDRLKKFEAGGMTEMALRVHDNQAEAIEIIGEAVAPALL
jgi:alkanesulfonate monooxygenase SsuD/methylene tetrahydromethanopterin reductase-like flavin-dependent oxidoreductase (luciferase family)